MAWCGGCEWNLPVYEPARRRPELGWRWVDRSTHPAAYRLTGRQFAALGGGEGDRPGWGLPRLTLATAGVLFLLALLAVLVAGGYLTVGYWPQPLAFTLMTLTDITRPGPRVVRSGGGIVAL